MDGKKVYFEGECCGLYGAGSVILARRDDKPEVLKGNYYTIDEIIATELGACARNQGIVLKEVNGVYFKKTFKVDRECFNRMKEKDILTSMPINKI